MKSIEEQITESITAQLAQIRLNAGDNFNVAADDGESQGNSSLPANVTLRSGDSVPITSPLGRDTYRKTYFVECPVAVSDDSTTDSIDRAASRIGADVVKAVMDDYTQADLALNTRIKSVRQEASEQFCGAIVTFEVDFWTLKDDPFTQ